jgi:hypothetical protein
MCSRGIEKEKEPNDSFAGATAVTIGRPVQGHINTLTDRDFYKFTVDSDSILSASVSGVKGVNLAFRLWGGGADPVLLKHVDDSRKSSPEIFPNLYVTPGEYYIDVFQGDKDQKSFNIENFYTVNLSLRPLIAEEAEPNDSPDYATPVTPGNKIAGLFSPSFNPLNENDSKTRYREEDWFSFETSAGSDSPVLADITISGVPGIIPELALLGPDKTVLAEVSGKAPGEGAVIKGVGIKSTGICYVRAASSGFTSNGEVQYLLTVAISEYSSSEELEPNESHDTANRITDGRISGSINGTKDTDFFIVKNESPGSFFRIELEPQQGIDPVLTFYGDNRKKITEIDNGRGGAAEIYPNIYAKGDLYISVKARTASETGNGYQLTVSSLENQKITDMEPNDSRAHAVQVKSSEITGYTSFRGDLDYYLLEYENRRRVEFTIKSGKDSTLKISVTDPMGYTVKSIESSRGKETVLREFIDRKGYLIVESLTEDYTNPYLIKIRSAE